MSRIESFERMLANGQDSPLLRFSLGREYLHANDPGQAALHLGEAVNQDPAYSAAWKELGRAHQQAGNPQQAARAWQAGIEAAETSGDKQAAKEMRVFIKRLPENGS